MWRDHPFSQRNKTKKNSGEGGGWWRREVGQNLKKQGEGQAQYGGRMKNVHIKTDKLSVQLNYTSMEIAIHDFISFQQ